MSRSKILIIDDDKDIVFLLATFLKKENFDVIYAYNGQEGLSKYLSEKPHLILLDITLPSPNGYGICRKIRRELGDVQTPIIMLTAKKEDTDKIIGRVMGAEKYLTKPFELETVLNEIKQLLPG